MATKTEQSRRQSILLAALGHYAKKQSQRSHVPVGATPVSASIHGIVGKASVDMIVAGTLNVGADVIKSKSSSPPAADLVACLIAELPSDAARARVLDRLAAHYVATSILPAPEKRYCDLAKAWLAKLKTSTSTTTSGAVSFAVMD